jgi:hypothetical protein
MAVQTTWPFGPKAMSSAMPLGGGSTTRHSPVSAFTE